MDYGQRPDGTKKGLGYFGELKRRDGGVSTEISVGVGINGKEMNIPLIVPSLNKDELAYLLNNNIKSRSFMDKMPKTIIDKAYEHAVSRIELGKSPFAEEGEAVKPPIE